MATFIAILIQLFRIVYPFDCVPEFELTGFPARSIYYHLGDVERWTDAIDVAPAGTLRVGTDSEVWVYYSPLADTYSVYVFDHPPTALEPHPCGAGAIQGDVWRGLVRD